MTGIYGAFKTDSEAVDNGRWIKIFIKDDYICEIKCRPSDADINVKYQLALTEAIENSEDLPEGKDTKLLKVLPEVFSTSVVTDWRDVLGEDGDPISCTPANVKKLLTELPKLMTALHTQARDWTEFREARSEAVVGNLKKSSTTRSSGRRNKGNGSRTRRPSSASPSPPT